MTDVPRRRSTGRPAGVVRDGLVLGLAVGTSGLAFGAAAVTAGLTVAQACVLSLIAYTGASQFALAAALAAGGGLAAGTAGAILLGSRNTFYSLRLASLLGVRGPRTLLAALGVTDESTAMAVAQPDPEAGRAGFWATFASLYLTWNLASLAGALGAGQIGSPSAFGLDVVGPAAFLALLWPRLRAGWTERGVALAGAAVALVATPVLPPGVPVILAAAAALAGLLAPAEQARRDEAGAGQAGMDESSPAGGGAGQGGQAGAGQGGRAGAGQAGTGGPGAGLR